MSRVALLHVELLFRWRFTILAKISVYACENPIQQQRSTPPSLSEFRVCTGLLHPFRDLVGFYRSRCRRGGYAGKQLAYLEPVSERRGYSNLLREG